MQPPQVQVEHIFAALPAAREGLYSDGTEEPMNVPDKEEVKRLIADSRRGFPAWAKESLAFGIVMIGASFIVHSYIPAQIGNQTSGMASDINVLKSGVSGIQSDVADIKKELKDALNRALDRALQVGSAKGATLEQGRSAIRLANHLKIPLEPEAVRSFGLLAVSTYKGSSDPQGTAWAGFQECLEQRSIQPAVLTILDSMRWVVHSPIVIPNATLSPTPPVIQTFQTVPPVPYERSYRMSMIGREDADAPESGVAPEFVYSRGVAGDRMDFPIEGVHMRNVMLRNVRVLYQGGPIILENVLFVDCEFDLFEGPRTIELAKLILQSNPVTFSAPE